MKVDGAIFICVSPTGEIERWFHNWNTETWTREFGVVEMLLRGNGCSAIACGACFVRDEWVDDFREYGRELIDIETMDRTLFEELSKEKK